MEDTSFLFSGIKFDKKKFAKDFERFKVKKENKESEVNPGFVNITVTEAKVGKKSIRKRKRKGSSEGSVEGFSVFKSVNAIDETEQNNEEDEKNFGKKEVFRQQERDAILRKEHGIHISGSNVPSPLQSFEELSTRYGCKPYLLRNFAALGYKEPTPIQRQAIPVLLSGRECFASAPTGSGKTLAFICPILIKLKHGLKDGIRAVVLCHTRELAAQTTRNCKRLSQGKKFYIKLMTKELAKSADFSKLPCDILVSTPSRLKFAIQKRRLDLSRVQFLVLDESDNLFERGFMEEIDFIVKACSNPSIIRMLFSATLPDTVEQLARTIMHDAVRIIVGKKNTASPSVKQKLIFVGSEEGKFLALRQIFSESLNPPVLIFVQDVARAKQLYRELASTDIKVDVTYGDLPQEQRDNAINNFRAGKTWVLIACKVLDRGVDFKGLNCVINYDFPESASQYIHRIGRTGRAERAGEAITFYTELDVPYLRNIANVMLQSGCEVPSWIMSMAKGKWKKHRPTRDSISGPNVDSSEDN
ncbi:DEAD-box ATP-dependent RNA helicase 57 [Amaranthus tricolor]|uniref:DEAD-box ATP-dependent RNA helicase 57 n=1 Tax=Amaranthus tricolor TaxID=29722 RepID=UPI00258A5790|nr:DEAD-box ATP-dependent RNA helicase 57 [Amaranthus tricolor]XP_057534541.1 DEAD-box ATP-dependent RNA helicase 57 [Amaranthus tricolor]XP_057534542.1 DEAD-box ATP-dependent RNA helicase 57 [Amaranthus tricolor]